MFECHCGKTFDTERQLNGHRSSHNRGEKYKAARKSKIDRPTCVCEQCQKEFEFSHSSFNKFCSTICYSLHWWEKKSIPRIEQGLGGDTKRYLKEKFGDKCFECGQLPEWNGKPLTLQLDHIDGNSDNNLLSNLRLLCPNCHTQTHTFGSKGNGNRYKKDTKRNKYLREYKASVV